MNKIIPKLLNLKISYFKYSTWSLTTFRFCCEKLADLQVSELVKAQESSFFLVSIFSGLKELSKETQTTTLIPQSSCFLKNV
jgi:hypothetical protein